MFGEALSEVLGKRGFVMVATEEVAEASKAEGLGAISLLDPPSAERLAPLAKRLEAAYLLIPYADVTSYSQSGTVEIEVPAPTDRPGDVHPGTGLLPGDMESIPVPVTRHSLQAGVRVRVVEGDTGKAVWDVVRYATRGVHLRQFTSARRELMREVAEQVVVIWREPALR
jgi:hypothetical protein